LQSFFGKISEKMSYADFMNRTDGSASGAHSRRQITTRRTLTSSDSDQTTPKQMLVEYNEESYTDDSGRGDISAKPNLKLEMSKNNSDSNNSVTPPKKTPVKTKKSGFFGFGGGDKDATDEEVEDFEEEDRVEESRRKEQTDTNITSAPETSNPDYLNDQPPEEAPKPGLLWRVSSGAFTGVKAVGGFGISAVSTVAGATVNVVKGTGNVIIHPVQSVKNGASNVSALAGGTVTAVKSTAGLIGSGVTTVGVTSKNIVVGTAGHAKNIITDPKGGVKNVGEVLGEGVKSVGSSVAEKAKGTFSSEKSKAE